MQEFVDSTDPWATHSIFATHDTAEGHLHQHVPNFDTWMHDQESPTLGRIEQSEYRLQSPPSQCSPSRIPSEPTECRTRAHIVRRWLLNHADWPYPTSEERAELVAATGLSERQLNACLSNLCSREKHCKPNVMIRFSSFVDNAGSVCRTCRRAKHWK